MEMNQVYMGRYVFSGFFTQHPPVLTENWPGRSFVVTQTFEHRDVHQIRSFQRADLPNQAVIHDVNVLKLPYRNINFHFNPAVQAPPVVGDLPAIGIFLPGNPPEPVTVHNRNSFDSDAYTPPDGVFEVHHIVDTGELVMSDFMREQMRNGITMTYEIRDLRAGELNPIVYFPTVEIAGGLVPDPNAVNPYVAMIPNPLPGEPGHVLGVPPQWIINPPRGDYGNVPNMIPDPDFVNNNPPTIPGEIDNPLPRPIIQDPRWQDWFDNRHDNRRPVPGLQFRFEGPGAPAWFHVSTGDRFYHTAETVPFSPGLIGQPHTDPNFAPTEPIPPGFPQNRPIADIELDDPLLNPDDWRPRIPGPEENPAWRARENQRGTVIDPDPANDPVWRLNPPLPSSIHVPGTPPTMINNPEHQAWRPPMIRYPAVAHHYDITNPDHLIRFEMAASNHITINSLAPEVYTATFFADMRALMEFVENFTLTSEQEVRAFFSNPLNGGYTGAALDNAVSEFMSNEFRDAQGVLHDRFSNLLRAFTHHRDIVQKEHASLGSRMNRIDMLVVRLEEEEINYTALLSANEDTPLQEAIMRKAAAEAAFQASLRATAMSSQLSLVNFLRG